MNTHKAPPHWISVSTSQNETNVSLHGHWTLHNAAIINKKVNLLNQELRRQTQALPTLRIDMSDVENMDTAGALLVWILYDHLKENGYAADFGDVPAPFKALLSVVGAVRRKHMPPNTKKNALIERLDLLGRATFSVIGEAYTFLSFLGQITLTLWRSTFQPWRLRYNAILYHMEEVGIKALPLLTLLAFLIGIVISYQGAQQLQQFGADLYVINLLGVSILREIGVLMTAIIIAGRSGSAFTAQIGTMQVNQETDAMRTLGLQPIEVLVIPRVIALTITLPFLVLFSNFMALLGGAIMCWAQLDIGFGTFLHQLQTAIDMWTLGVGLIKAPVFAFVIGVVGCYQGFRVSGSAESVGKLTTRSVVHAIFLVILLDAFFSILFAWLKV